MSLEKAAPLARAGDVIAGKYRVDRVLGAGGMGVVVAAHHIELDEKVALKFLLPDALLSPEAVTRFAREARAAAKIKNEHVARVTDVGQLDNGSPYMVMEYLEGSDLADLLGREGPLPVEQAVDFVLQACEALAEAHTLGIVHRDLKPANLFRVRRPDGTFCIKVLDFGISKVTSADPAADSMTKTSAFLGSPLYMSPEQMQRSKGVDSRTDIWSLGIILFELLTARAPFDALGVTELIFKIATEPAASVRASRVDAPAGLDRIVATCLEKDRTNRFQTIGDLAVALQEFGSPRARLSVEGIVGLQARAGITSSPPAPNRDFTTSNPIVAAVVGGDLRPSTEASWGQTASTHASGGKRAASFSVAASVLVLGAVGLLARSAMRGGTEAPTSSPTSFAAEVHAATTSSAEPTTQRAVASTLTPIATSSAPTHGSAAPAATAPTKLTSIGSAPRAQAPASAGRVTPAATATSRASCDPPFTLDADGRKHFKAECYAPQ